MKKEWIENGTFDPIPMNIYKEYDEARKDLTKQVFVRLKDALSLDTVAQMLKILVPADILLLRTIQKKGPLSYETAKAILGEDYKDTVTKCKARSLVIPTSVGTHHYTFDLSSIGLDILKELDKGKEDK